MSDLSVFKDFKFFYDSNEAFVRKSLYYLIKDEAKIDDIVQNVFVKVWKKSDSFANRSEIKTWLYRITVNCAYDHLRKEKKHSNHLSVAEQDQSSIENSQLQNRQLIKNAISLLDKKLKITFILYYIQQLPVDEISKSLDIPEGTVKSRLSKARRITSEYLKSQGVNYE